MPGLLPFSYRSGNRAEYFAQYVLSGLGVSSPVLRQEDIGIDFHCAISRRDAQRLYFDSPFAIQVGTIGGKQFRYGVNRKEKELKFRPYEIDWLFSQSLPLFMATVDQESLTIRIYSTSPMWITRYSYGNVGEIVFLPDAKHDPVKDSQQEELLPEGFGDRHTYHIPLYDPIAELCISTFDEELLEKARAAMRKAIATERKNIRYRDFGVHFVEWLLNIVPNNSSEKYEVGHFYAWNSAPGQNITQQLDSLLPALIALGQNLSAQNNLDALASIVPAFGLFSKDKLPDFVSKMMSDFENKVEQGRGEKALSRMGHPQAHGSSLPVGPV